MSQERRSRGEQTSAEHRRDIEAVHEAIREFSARLAAFRTRHTTEAGAEAPRPSPEALAELVAELELAHEELRVQHEELLAAQRAALAHRRAYEAILRLGDAYVFTAPDGRIAECNAAAAALLNVPEAPLKGKPLANFLAPDSRPAYRTLLERMRVAAPDSVAEGALELQPRRGAPVLCTASVVLATATEDDPGGIRWMFRPKT